MRKVLVVSLMRNFSVLCDGVEEPRISHLLIVEFQCERRVVPLMTLMMCDCASWTSSSVVSSLALCWIGEAEKGDGIEESCVEMEVLEVSIGHALIGEALYAGLDATVKAYTAITAHG